MSSESTSPRPIIYLGLDVHKDSITIAVLPHDAKTPTRLDRLPNDLPKLKRFDVAAVDLVEQRPVLFAERIEIQLIETNKRSIVVFCSWAMAASADESAFATDARQTTCRQLSSHTGGDQGLERRRRRRT